MALIAREESTTGRDLPEPASGVVGIVSSAGGLAALRIVLSGLPSGFPAAVVIIQHLDPLHRSVLAEILDRSCLLPVAQATAGDKAAAGLVLVGPPDRHLLIDADGTVLLTQSDPVHFVRPSGDVLLESAAQSYRDRTIAVVLTGSGVDGAHGSRAVKEVGGTVIVQDPETAEFAAMPTAAVRTGAADLVIPVEDIAPALVALLSSRGAA